MLTDADATVDKESLTDADVLVLFGLASFVVEPVVANSEVEPLVDIDVLSDSD